MICLPTLVTPFLAVCPAAWLDDDTTIDDIILLVLETWVPDWRIVDFELSTYFRTNFMPLSFESTLDEVALTLVRVGLEFE